MGVPVAYAADVFVVAPVFSFLEVCLPELVAWEDCHGLRKHFPFPSHAESVLGCLIIWFLYGACGGAAPQVVLPVLFVLYPSGPEGPALLVILVFF